MDFHSTVYGKNFFEYQLPKLISGIGRLAEAVETHADAVRANTQALKEHTKALARCENDN